MQDELLEALRKHKWVGTRRRTNITDAPRDRTGNFLLVPIFSEVVSYPSLRLLVDRASPGAAKELPNIVFNRMLPTT